MRTLRRRPGSRRAARLTGVACAVALLSALVPLVGAGPVQADRRDTSAQCVLPNPSGWTGEGETTDYNQFQRPQGIRTAAMLFVDFPDAPAAEPTDAYA